MSRVFSWVSSLALLLLLSGCGYHFAASEQALPGNVQSVSIPTFSNDTAQAFLETTLTNQVRSRFSRYPGVALAADRQGEALLSGRILTYEVKASAFDALDSVIEYKATLTVEVVLTLTESGKPLWKNQIVWDGTFPGGIDKNLLEANERKAIVEIGERTAGEILYRMLDDF